MKAKQTGRRQFLKGGAALVGLAVGGISPANGEETLKPEVIRPTGVRPLGEHSRFEKEVRSGYVSPLGSHALTPLQDSQGIITPSALHFYVSHEPTGVLMDLDPQQYRLMIHGMVDRPLVLTLAEVKRLPSVSRIHFLECGGNSSPKAVAKAKTAGEAHGMTSCSEWTGVLVSQLLKEAGVQKKSNWLIMGAADPSNHALSIPMEKAMDDALVAYAQNGEPMPLDQGYPLRLVCPGWTGKAHVKWLNRIKAVDQPYMTLQDRAGLRGSEGASLIASDKARALHFEVYAKSLITFPSGGHQLPGRGFYEITGLAWSGAGAVRRVEVSTNGGQTWKDAQLQEPVLRKAHTRFRLSWKWDGEEAVLQSRCTDERGDVQPAVTETSKNWSTDPSDACRSVVGNYCGHIRTMASSAYIQSWRVAPDGSVHNAFVAPAGESSMEKSSLEEH